MNQTAISEQKTRNKTHKPTGLLIMNARERGEFLPEDLLTRLEEHLDKLEVVESYDHENFDWPAMLAKYQPEILFSSWSTPHLPSDLPLEETSLKYVCHLPGGIRNITPRPLLEKGLIVTNWGSSISKTVAECGLLLILGCLRRVSHWHNTLHNQKGWKSTRDGQSSLFGRQVGLHGFGRISQELAALLKPFSPRISTFSPSVPDEILESYGVERAEDLDSLFANSDIVVELAALTDRSRGMVKERHLRMIPKGGAFVNVGRAGVVDEEALLKVALEGDLQFGLDVFHTEPLPTESPLRGLSNVLLMPHVAGPTSDRMRDSGELALENIAAYCKGEELLSQVSLSQFDNMT